MSISGNHISPRHLLVMSKRENASHFHLTTSISHIIIITIIIIVFVESTTWLSEVFDDDVVDKIPGYCSSKRLNKKVTEM